MNALLPPCMPCLPKFAQYVGKARDMLSDVKMDEDFPTFVQFCTRHRIPVTVLSSGLRPIVTKFIQNSVSTVDDFNHIEIVCNDVIQEDRSWKVVFHDDRYSSTFDIASDSLPKPLNKGHPIANGEMTRYEARRTNRDHGSKAEKPCPQSGSQNTNIKAVIWKSSKRSERRTFH